MRRNCRTRPQRTTTRSPSSSNATSYPACTFICTCMLLLLLWWQQGVINVTLSAHLPFSIPSSSSSSSSSTALLQCTHATAQRTSLQQQPSLTLPQQRSLTRHQCSLSSN
jgi:hypothetical protein